MCRKLLRKTTFFAQLPEDSHVRPLKKNSKKMQPLGFCNILQIANRNAKMQLADNQKDMPIFFAFLQFCNFLVSKQTNRGDGLHLIKLTNID